METRFEGIETAVAPGDGHIEALPGPLPGTAGLRYREGGEPRTLELARPIGQRGSIRFWFLLDQTLQVGREGRNVDRQILHLPGLFRIRLGRESRTVHLLLQSDDRRGMPSKRVLLPGLPGPAWYHVAYEWDAEEGVLQGYLNGTPLRTPGFRIGVWESQATARELRLTIEDMAISDLAVSGDTFGPEDLHAEVGPLHAGSLDRLLGARELGPSTIDERRGRVLYENALDSADGVEGWVLEGPGRIDFTDGWMHMASEQPDGPMGHIVHWCPEEFPESYIAEWEIQPTSEYGLCIVFFSARGRNGEDIFDPALQPRDGIFDRYHTGDIDAYHVSYYANTPNEPGRITSNLRWNRGFYLAANGPPGIPAGSREAHRVALMKDGATIELSVDGRRIIEFRDDGTTFGPVHGGGKIGLRQMQWMSARYRNFRVYEVAR